MTLVTANSSENMTNFEITRLLNQRSASNAILEINLVITWVSYVDWTSALSLHQSDKAINLQVKNLENNAASLGSKRINPWNISNK